MPLHNISNKLGRHIQNICRHTSISIPDVPAHRCICRHSSIASRVFRHTYTISGTCTYTGLADALIFRPGPSLVNRHKVNHKPCIFLVSWPYRGSSPRHWRLTLPTMRRVLEAAKTRTGIRMTRRARVRESPPRLLPDEGVEGGWRVHERRWPSSCTGELNFLRNDSVRGRQEVRQSRGGR
jgi:hypothetical protein